MKSSLSRSLLLGAGLALATLSSCAFLNTFYNAKVAFDSAYRDHSKLMRQYPDSVIAPSGTILANYDRAIEKSGKVLQVYSKNKRWLDDATFLMGKAFFYKGELGKAIRRFLDLQDEFPGSPYIPESYLLLGEAYLQNGDLTKAEETFNLVLDKYPQLNKNEDVSMYLAQIAIRRQGKSMAIELLDKIRKGVHSDEKKIELILQTAEIYSDLRQYGRAANILKEAPRKPKLINQMYRIDMLLLTCYVEMDSLKQAGALADAMLKKRDYDLHTSAVLLKKATILDREKSYDDALALYDRVAKSSDSTEFAGESWFAMAVIYQKAKGDMDQAKVYYVKAAAKLKDKQLLDLANRRIKALATIDTLAHLPTGAPAKAASTAPTMRTPTEFTMGELFWLELAEPDSAYRHYAAVVADTSLDTESHAKALYAEGYLQLNAFKDTAKADTLFDKLVRSFPSNRYSRRAQEDRGKPVTVRTQEDSAWDAFDGAEKTLFDQDSALAATRAYLAVHSQYPETEAGAKSLFAAAWICDNVLNKKKTALSLYGKVCTEYPASAYCIDEAKPRMKVAADSLAVYKVRAKKEARAAQKNSANAPPTATPPSKTGSAEVKTPVADTTDDEDSSETQPADTGSHGVDQLEIPQDTVTPRSHP